MSLGQERAFPLFIPHPNGNEYHYGLTRRELFAAMAMQALISSSLEELTLDESLNGNLGDHAVMYADELIAALAEEPPNNQEKAR